MLLLELKSIEIVLQFTGQINNSNSCGGIQHGNCKTESGFQITKIHSSDKDLSVQGLIVQVVFQEIKVPVKFKEIWWEEMKLHVQKKDEHQSNCRNSVKNGLLGK